MAAKVLTEAEVKLVLAVIAQRRHATRDRLIFLFTLLAGMRACEVADLQKDDVLQADGKPKTGIVLKASQTKGRNDRFRSVGLLCDSKVNMMHTVSMGGKRPFVAGAMLGRLLSRKRPFLNGRAKRFDFSQRAV